MGIFGDIFGGIERFAGSEFGQAAFGVLGQAAAARFAPPPARRGAAAPVRVPMQAISPGAVVGAGGGPFSGVPVAQLAQRAFESLGGGPPMSGVFQLAGLGLGPSVVNAPQPVPFALDPSCPSFFPNGRVSNPPARFITATNPTTGALTWWEHAGQPILFSRDLRVVKRVRRIASKAGTVTRRRTRKR